MTTRGYSPWRTTAGTAVTAAATAHLVLSTVQSHRSAAWFVRRRTSRLEQATSANPRHVVIVPAYDDAESAGTAVQSLGRAARHPLVHRAAIVTWAQDDATADAVDRAIVASGETKIVHVVNRSPDPSKAAQLGAALDQLGAILGPGTIVSVYDSDSQIDPTVFDAIALLPPERLCAYQQSPFYPLPDSFLPTTAALAAAQAIHSTSYHFSTELPAYRRSRLGRGAVTHLIGHGEHMTLEALRAAGGFQPPSCDSSLGFALSYRTIPILPIPVVDTAGTALNLRDTWAQCARWFAGCDLFWRERRSAPGPTRRRTAAALVNNLRWMAGPPLVLGGVMLAGRGRRAKVAAVLGSGALLRHVALRRGYNYLAVAAGRSPIALRTWLGWFPYYVLFRIIWSLPPWAHYLRLLRGQHLMPRSTPKTVPRLTDHETGSAGTNASGSTPEVGEFKW